MKEQNEIGFAVHPVYLLPLYKTLEHPSQRHFKARTIIPAKNDKNHNNMSLTCALVHREYLEVVGHDPHILDHIAGQMYARADARFICKIMKI